MWTATVKITVLCYHLLCAAYIAFGWFPKSKKDLISAFSVLQKYKERGGRRPPSSAKKSALHGCAGSDTVHGCPIFFFMEYATICGIS